MEVMTHGRRYDFKTRTVPRDAIHEGLWMHEPEVPTEVGYEYISDPDKCIACGFCRDTCPCGIWVMQPF